MKRKTRRKSDKLWIIVDPLCYGSKKFSKIYRDWISVDKKYLQEHCDMGQTVVSIETALEGLVK